MTEKRVCIDFASPAIFAAEYFDRLKEAVYGVSCNLWIRHKTRIRINKEGEYLVVLTLQIPDDSAESFSFGRHLRGIAQYLLRDYPEEFEQYRVGNRLLVYKELT